MSTHINLGGGFYFLCYSRGTGHGVHAFIGRQNGVEPLHHRTDGGLDSEVLIDCVVATTEFALQSTADGLRRIAEQISPGTAPAQISVFYPAVLANLRGALSAIAREVGILSIPHAVDGPFVDRVITAIGKQRYEAVVEAVAVATEQPIADDHIDAIWLRTDPAGEGPDAMQHLRVLVKLVGDPYWRVAMDYLVEPMHQSISHISEASGMPGTPTRAALPIDPLEDRHLQFLECAACAAKPGSPSLCPSCLHNRDLISQLKRAAPKVVAEDSAVMVQRAVHDLRAQVDRTEPPENFSRFHLPESFGRYPDPKGEIELLDEGEKFRVRIRETHGKASIFLTADELTKVCTRGITMVAANAQRVTP